MSSKAKPVAKTVEGREPMLTIYQRREVGSVFRGAGDQSPVEAAFALIGKDLEMHDTESGFDTYDFTLNEQVFKIEVERDLTPEVKAEIAKRDGDDSSW